MSEREDKAPPPGKNEPPSGKKPAGRLETVEDVKAAIASLLERLKQLQNRRGKPREGEEEAERAKAHILVGLASIKGREK